MAKSPKTFPRGRLQFSLRTLLIVVLAYGGAWLLTIKWGANQVARERAGGWLEPSDYLRDGAATELGDGKMRLDGMVASIMSIDLKPRRKPVSEDFQPETTIVSVRAPLPFVLLSSEEILVRDMRIEGRNEISFIWFFGFKYQWPPRLAPGPFNQIGDDEEEVAK